MAKTRKHSSAKPNPEPASKICARCGRSFDYRPRWARSWASVRYCSDDCRSHKPGEKAAQIEREILALLEQRGRDKTLCPSEVARRVFAAEEALTQLAMEEVRRAARRLVAQGQLEITQGGRVVSPDTARGPIRLRLAARSGQGPSGVR